MPLDVTINADALTIEASLPGIKADNAEATFEHGVLRLRIPKAEQVKPRQIRISPVTDGQGQQSGPARRAREALTSEPMKPGVRAR